MIKPQKLETIWLSYKELKVLIQDLKKAPMKAVYVLKIKLP